MSDIFNGPWLNQQDYERFVHLNLISRVNSLELINLELTGKLQVAQGRVDELEEQNALLKEHLDQACGNLKKRDTRIAELKAALREALDYIDDPYNDLAIQIGKTLEKSK